MDLIEARQLAKSTILRAYPALGAGDGLPERVWTTPRLTFQGLSPVVTIEPHEIEYVWAARQLYTLTDRVDVWVWSLVTDSDGTLPASVAEHAEDEVDTIVQAIIPALFDAGFLLDSADMRPKNAPWRKMDGKLFYRVAQLPIRFEDEHGY